MKKYQKPAMAQVTLFVENTILAGSEIPENIYPVNPNGQGGSNIL